MPPRLSISCRNSARSKRFLALHGDKFDNFYQEHPLMYVVGTRFYALMQWLGPWTRRFCKFLKRETKWYTHAITNSIEGALAYGKAKSI